MKNLSVREVIRRLLEYNLDAEFEVISDNRVQDFEFAIGSSEGVEPKNCESVSIYVVDKNTEDNKSKSK